MKRENVLVSEDALARQREFEAKIKEMFTSREAHPVACVDTFGCQQNVADGQKLMGMLADSGFTFTEDPKEADLVILNTCAVREHAEQRVFGNLGILTHTKKENPEQVICLCGCMAQEERVSQRVKESYRHVDLVFGPHALWKFPELLWQVYETRKRVFAVDNEDGTIAEGIPVVREKGVKAWVSIMYGCNNFCSYCIVPYVRGRERSRDPQCVLQEVRELVEAGYKDITLLGQNVNSYGNDLGLDYHFPDLLEDIDKIPGEYLIRFMSSHPKDATNRLFDVMAKCPHVAKQLHLPFQSGNDRVLKEMNRRYTRAQYLAEINYAKKVMPGLVLTSDVIIGFPGVKVLGEDIRYIKQNEVTLQPKGSFFYGSMTYWLFYIIPALAFIIFFIIYRKQAATNANVAKMKTKKANKVATKRMKLAGKLLSENKKDAFYDEVLKALWGYISDKLSIPVSRLSKDNIEEKLRNHGVSEELIKEFLNALNDCEFARFAPGDENQAMDKVYSSSIEVISRMENSIKH